MGSRHDSGNVIVNFESLVECYVKQAKLSRDPGRAEILSLTLSCSVALSDNVSDPSQFVTHKAYIPP